MRFDAFRHGPRRAKSFWARRASTCWAARRKFAPLTDVQASSRSNATPSRRGSPNEQIAALEAARAAEKQVADQRIEELSASLRREQMQCSVVERALETARKDFARLMREAMALQREQAAPDDPARLRPASAA
jgi:chromosome segregation ATPase